MWSKINSIDLVLFKHTCFNTDPKNFRSINYKLMFIFRILVIEFEIVCGLS